MPPGILNKILNRCIHVGAWHRKALLFLFIHINSYVWLLASNHMAYIFHVYLYLSAYVHMCLLPLIHTHLDWHMFQFGALTLVALLFYRHHNFLLPFYNCCLYFCFCLILCQTFCKYSLQFFLISLLLFRIWLYQINMCTMLTYIHTYVNIHICMPLGYYYILRKQTYCHAHKSGMYYYNRDRFRRIQIPHMQLR